MPAPKLYAYKTALAVAGNVDTDITFDGDAPMQVLFGQVVLTTDVTVANRRAKLQIINPAGAVAFDTHSGAVVVASATAQHHEFMQGVYRETSFIGNAIQVPIPISFIVPKGFTLRITVENGVAGDAYDYHVMAATFQ